MPIQRRRRHNQPPPLPPEILVDSWRSLSFAGRPFATSLTRCACMRQGSNERLPQQFIIEQYHCAIISYHLGITDFMPWHDGTNPCLKLLDIDILLLDVDTVSRG